MKSIAGIPDIPPLAIEVLRDLTSQFIAWRHLDVEQFSEAIRDDIDNLRQTLNGQTGNFVKALEHGHTQAEIGAKAVNEIISTTQTVIKAAEVTESTRLKVSSVESRKSNQTFLGSLIPGSKGRRLARAKRAHDKAHTTFGEEHRILVSRCLGKVKKLLEECNELKKAFESIQVGFSKAEVSRHQIQVRNALHVKDVSERRQKESERGAAGFGLMGGAGLALFFGPLAIPAVMALAGGAMVASATSNATELAQINAKALDTQRFLQDLQRQIALAISTVAEQVKHWGAVRLLLEEALEDMDALPNLSELRLSLERWMEVKTNYLDYASQAQTSKIEVLAIASSDSSGVTVALKVSV